MSVLTNIARLCASRFFLLAVLLTATILLPQVSSADTLPIGVTERQTCGAFSVDIYSYGGGLMYSVTPTINSHQRLSYISPTENCAVVEWQSSIPAASQVLFSELGSEPVSIDLTAENFGYPYASTQNNAGTASHTAVLEGLTPGQAYSYRLVTRSHPSAIPTISDARVLIAGPSTALPTPVVTVTPVTAVPSAPVPTPTPVPVVTLPPVTTEQFDAEKFPIAPVATDTPKVASTSEEDNTVSVPSAVTAADDALGETSKEGSMWARIKGFFAGLMPDDSRFSLSSNIGLFEKDRYIIPALFFLGLLFLLQQLVLPAFSVSLKNPILYWLSGAVVLTVLSAVFMFYYVTLIGIALFLGLLAWYLLQSLPEDQDPTEIQPKLLNEGKEPKKTSKENRPSENLEK